MSRRLTLALAVALAVAGCRSSGRAPHSSTLPATTRATSQPASLSAQLDEILNRLASTGAIVAARVIDPETGEELFAQDASRPVTPASNMKLVVMTAAIDFFGPDAEFETDLAVVGDDLYLIGHGDPGTGDEQIAAKYKDAPTTLIDAWADELTAKGLTRFAGNFYYYDRAFEEMQTHPSWNGQLSEWYSAPVSGLNFNDNCIDAVVIPSKTKGERPRVKVVPETSNTIILKNEATSGGEGKHDVDWSREETQNVYTVTGNALKVGELQSKPVTDPGAFFADAIQTRFAKRGITITGQIMRADTPPTGTMTKLAPAKSSIEDVLARIGKNSQNMMAEALAKKLGLEFETKAKKENPLGSWASAETAIRDYWHREKIDATGFVFEDGSGLSSDNRVTTKLISDLLVKAYHKPYFETFKNMLTVGGVDGTIAKRFADVPNRVYAKTGFISGVRSLSGYVKTDNGKYRVFSILYNKIPRRGSEATKPYEALQDEAVRLLMKN